MACWFWKNKLQKVKAKRKWLGKKRMGGEIGWRKFWLQLWQIGLISSGYCSLLTFALQRDHLTPSIRVENSFPFKSNLS